MDHSRVYGIYDLYVRITVMMQNTLHDRNVIAIDAMENDLVMGLQSGILETASPYRLIDGYLTANRQFCECVIEIYHEGDIL